MIDMNNGYKLINTRVLSIKTKLILKYANHIRRSFTIRSDILLRMESKDIGR